ncbi:NDR1/HIN1-like protein 1 [Linum perenne]
MCNKECGHDDSDDNKSGAMKSYIIMAVAALVIIGLTILILWAILRPTKPTFILQDATLYALNLTNSNLFLTTTLQVTLSSRNPNRRIGIDYTKLGIYASYRNQQITLSTQLPQGYLGTKDITVWSPFLYGVTLPVSPALVQAVGQDLSAGVLILNVKMYGRLKWKLGSWLSGKYHIAVNCPAYLRSAAHLQQPNNDNAASMVDVAGIKYQFHNQGCNVQVST